MIQKSSIVGMGMLFAIAILMIVSLNNTPGSKITGMFALGPDTRLEDINSTYSLAPLFEASADYTLEEYEGIENKARDLLHQCRAPDPAIVNTCVTTEIAILPGWTIVENQVVENQDFMYRFDVQGKKAVPVYDADTKKMETKPVTYRFALDFTE